MKKFVFIFAISLVSLQCSYFQKVETPQTPKVRPQLTDVKALETSKRLDTIAFGSCANQDAPQPIWSSIAKAQPDLFIFTGDNVYASHPNQQPISAQYDKLVTIPEYAMIRSQIPFLAIWDDHDYGENDGGFENPLKDEAKEEFLNHWSYASKYVDAVQDGIYHSLMIGPQSEEVQVILLDTRWNRSPLQKPLNPINPFHRFDPTDDTSTTVLGEKQWQWLEKELQKKSRLKIIVSSIQLIPEKHGFEKWGNFPHERKRFFDLLARHKVQNAVLISGDRHIGTISKTKLPNNTPLYEVTASAINRPGKFQESDPTYVGKNFSLENFGLIQIDWKKNQLTLQLKDIDGTTVNKIITTF